MRIFPKNGTNTASTSCCLFTSQTASTVIAASGVLADITATTYGSYVPIVLNAVTWGASSISAGLGVKTAYTQLTFATVTYGPSTINGFYIIDPSNTFCVAQANFDDATAVTVNTNDVIKVTPAIIYGN